jgi:adenylate cyclase
MNFGEDINVLKVLIDNTIARNPSSAFSWFWSGWMRTFSGEADLAIDHFEKSLRLDPRATRLAFHLTGIGICHFFRRRFDQAAAVLETSLHELPSYPTTSRFLISCYAHLGRLAEARELVARHEVRSGERWLKGGALFRDDDQRALLFDGLNRAMGTSP